MLNRSEDIPDQSRLLLVDGQESIHQAYRLAFANLDFNEARDPVQVDPFVGSGIDALPVTACLDRHRFALTHAAQGDEAVELMILAQETDQPFDVAFIDPRMPLGINNLQALSRLWQIDPLLQVVICSTLTDFNYADLLQRFGSKDNLLLLKKPFSSEEAFQMAVMLTRKRRVAIAGRAEYEQLLLANRKLVNEIDQRKTSENQLHHAATHDPLTNLPNRHYLQEILEARFICETFESRRADALIFLDVDDFKHINDSLGHVVGDQLLIEVGRRLQTRLQAFHEVHGDSLESDARIP